MTTATRNRTDPHTIHAIGGAIVIRDLRQSTACVSVEIIPNSYTAGTVSMELRAADVQALIAALETMKV